MLWKGYPLTEAIWETESHLINIPDILEDYLRSGWRPGIAGDTAAVVRHLGAEDSKVLPVRTGTDGVGASAVGTGESLHGTALGRLVYGLHWHSQVPCLQSLVGEMAAVGKFPSCTMYILFFLGLFFFRVRGRPLSYGGE